MRRIAVMWSEKVLPVGLCNLVWNVSILWVAIGLRSQKPGRQVVGELTAMAFSSCAEKLESSCLEVDCTVDAIYRRESHLA